MPPHSRQDPNLQSDPPAPLPDKRTTAGRSSELDKRRLILAGAARLFASRPFDEVRLEEIARDLHIGKGTIYLYFQSKEELYGALLLEGVSQVVQELELVAANKQARPSETLAAMIRAMVVWARHNPHFFKLMPGPDARGPVPGLIERRRELGRLFEQVIRRGVRAGEFDDPHPDLTAQFIPGCLRAGMRHGPRNIGSEAMARHILRMILGGIARHENGNNLS